MQSLGRALCRALRELCRKPLAEFLAEPLVELYAVLVEFYAQLQ